MEGGDLLKVHFGDL
uniref:Uncharacterized protein n=1 Tax=Rhizophora mucronata TaxID=61149 RepID=A0A2P2NVT9_RHIMU